MLKLIRKSLVNKAIFAFAILLGLVVIAGIVMIRTNVTTISLTTFIALFTIMLVVLLGLFIFDVIRPINHVVTQVRNLLTGNNYKRVDPMSIDEIGVFTHFFNEITRDLEKISYDVKERRRMSSELDIASKIQKDILPKTAPEAPGLDVVAKTKAAAEVGGDSFDFLTSADGNNVYAIIGDVTGHGVPAGLVMMMVNTLVHAMVSRGLTSAKDIMVNTNTLLTPRISSRLFMTSVMLRWDKVAQKMYYTGAGHEHVLIYRSKTEEVEAVRSGGIALGMIPDNSQIAKEEEIKLEIGDVVVLYTDGITEARNQQGEMYELDGLVNSLKKHGFRPSAESVFDNLTKDFSNFVQEYVQADDITMIVVKYLGPDAATQKVKLTIATDESEGEKLNKNWDWV